MKRYKSANDRYRELFGEKTYKLALQGGATCPNRDGKKGFGGCIFCGEEGSGEFAEKRLGFCDSNGGEYFLEQIERAINRISGKTNCRKFIAYYQSFTSTYMPHEDFEKMLLPALYDDRIVAVSVATRPDCLSDDILKILSDFNKRKKVFLELGLQTSNENTAKLINRGYDLDEYLTATNNLRDRKIETITHLIIGLPGETVNIVDGIVYVTSPDKSQTIQLDDSFVTACVPFGTYGPYEVPANSYFMLGDNRNDSLDSRFWSTTNYVRDDQLIGKVVFKYYPNFEKLD